MKTVSFKCTLVTDIVLNQKAATEGNQESLSFIPGSNFLGIAAGHLYKDDNTLKKNNMCWEIFHSGKVRFGDAHPELNGKRALHVPASMYYPKLKNKEGLYIHHAVANPDDPDYKEFQPKQCRTGFYVFDGTQGIEVEVEKSFAIKSAYDSNKRKSKDSQMYGYQSLLPGSSWLFDVSIDNEALIEPVTNALTGRKRIGRSRTAQYGLVQIEALKEALPTIETSKQQRDYVLVYADARLIFFDEYGIPTFQPTAEELGFSGGKINWEQSQIRTFQYAPWNFKRQARDTDRCGIEKGSVFFIEKAAENTAVQYTGNGFAGKYQNEGFGKMIINPAFLDADEKGKAVCWLKEEDKPTQPKNRAVTHASPLFAFLKKKEQEQAVESEIYRLVNEFVFKHENLFSKEVFASQWSSIRAIVFKCNNKDMIERELFTKTEVRNGKRCDMAYLTHGVAKEKWDERNRRKIFCDFFNQIKDNSQFSDKDIKKILINLSAEMAKISGRK